MGRGRYILCLLIALVCGMAEAEPVDSVAGPGDAKVSPPEHRNLIESVIAYFDDSNKETKPRGFDVSFIGGPHYNSDTKFGIGMVAAGLYTLGTDTVTPVSNVSLYADVSTSGFYMVGIRGNNIFPQDRQRLTYDLFYSSYPRYYWGMGYETNVDDANKTKFVQRQLRVQANYLVRIAKDLYAGPVVEFSNTRARHVTDTCLWLGQRLDVNTYGVGVTVTYDTRDNLTATQHGVYVMLKQQFNPRWLGNHYAFGQTEVRANGYGKAWKGATLAASLHGRFTYGDTPWAMMSTFGGSYDMRGYYEGRYNDKCEMDATIELRQHVWRRSGAVAWVGVGTVFPDFRSLTMRHLLPCWGVGYRWEFKKNTNVRLDFGMGKNTSSFIFSINEAF